MTGVFSFRSSCALHRNLVGLYWIGSMLTS